MKKEGIQTRKRKQKSASSVSLSSLANSYAGDSDPGYSKSTKMSKSSSSARKTKQSGQSSSGQASSASAASAALNPATLPTPALLFDTPNYQSVMGNIDPGAMNIVAGQRLSEG